MRSEVQNAGVDLDKFLQAWCCPIGLLAWSTLRVNRAMRSARLLKNVQERTGYHVGRAWKRWFREQDTLDGLISFDAEARKPLIDNLYQRLLQSAVPWRKRPDEMSLRRQAESLVDATAEGLIESLEPSRAIAAVGARMTAEISDVHARVRETVTVMEHLPRTFQTVDQLQSSLVASSSGFDAAFVGRVRELALLSAMLNETSEIGDRKPVLIEGPGGFGKTRLAFEAAREFGITLATRTGAAITTQAFANVPSDRPCLLLIDDVHRSPDLSGLSAAMADPRFVNLHIVMTSRPGVGDQALFALGLNRKKCECDSNRSIGSRLYQRHY